MLDPTILGRSHSLSDVVRCTHTHAFVILPSRSKCCRLRDAKWLSEALQIGDFEVAGLSGVIETWKRKAWRFVSRSWVLL